MITIAHRVKTIIQYDKILVLKDGVMMEYGPPLELLNKVNGMFRESVLKQGQANLENMLRLAIGRKDTEQSND